MSTSLSECCLCGRVGNHDEVAFGRCVRQEDCRRPQPVCLCFWCRAAFPPDQMTWEDGPGGQRAMVCRDTVRCVQRMIGALSDELVEAHEGSA